MKALLLKLHRLFIVSGIDKKRRFEDMRSDFDWLASAGVAIPVEVKSGSGSKRHAALDKLMSVANYRLEKAIVLHIGNCELEGRIQYLPIYMAGLL